MTTTERHATAKIYLFPTRPPRLAGALLHDDKSVAEARSPRAAVAAAGGSWYHEEAIQDADRARKP